MFPLEKNIIRYIGNNIICSTRFIGKIDKLRVMSPFAILVKTKYQSVHGVNISMKNPIRISMFQFKNRFPKKYPNNGVQIKLIIKLVDVNLTFLKLSFISFNGISRNNPKSIKQRNMLIRYAVFSAINGMLEKINPNITAENIIIGSSLSIKSILSLFRCD